MVLAGAVLVVAFIMYALIRAPRLTARWAVVVALATLVVLGGAVSWIWIDHFIANMDRWRWLTAPLATMMPVVLYTTIGLVAITLVNWVWWARDPGPRRAPREAVVATPRLRFVRGGTVVVVVASLVVTGFGLREAQRPTLTPVSYSSNQLPAQFDGFRIALLSDIHVGAGLGRRFVQRVVDLVNAADVDLVVIAGDLSNGTPAQLGDDLLPLTQLKAAFGVLVTTGNHEFDVDGQGWIDWLNAHDLPVLDNAGVVLMRGGASIDVLGVNDRSAPAPHQADLQAAANQINRVFGVPVDGTGRFRILIAHEPVQDAGESTLPARLGVDLQLSGHTHGGQIWPLNYTIMMSQPVLDGTHVLNGVTVVTSRGAGSWGPPVRVAAPPEIPVITLRTSAAG